MNGKLNCLMLLTILLQLSFPVYALESEDEIGATLFTIQQELKALREDQRDIRKQLAELTRKVNNPPVKKSRNRDLDKVSINVDSDPVRGKKGAELVVVEFSDYECPFCRRHNTQTFPKLVENYVNKGLLKYIFKDFPLERIHKKAVSASVAANCAGGQGKYWEMHDLLFANQKALNDLSVYADELSLDKQLFVSCVEDENQAKEVRADFADGREIGVRSTPTFILGKQKDDGSIEGLRLITGAVSYDRFKSELDQQLSKLKPD